MTIAKGPVIIIAVLTLVIESYAQSFESDKNILSYFELLKAEWICDFNDSYLKTVDVRHGFISIGAEDDEVEPIFQMALFKEDAGADIIVLHVPGYACADISDCPTTEGRKTYFLKYENEEWADVGHVVMPPIRPEYFYKDSANAIIVNEYAPHAIGYTLPRYGYTIRLKLEICDDYINFDDPDEPLVSDEEIERLLTERKTVALEWNKELGVFQLEE